MNEQDFEKTDRSMMKNTKPVRERRVAPEFLKGFAASVIRRIESKNETVPVRPRGFRGLVPVFAVLVLAMVVVLRLPFNGPGPAPVPAEGIVEIAQIPTPAQEAETTLAEEIEALKELGAWTEDDEAAAGVAAEEEELEEFLA